VDVVYAEVGEREEERELGEVVPQPRTVLHGIVYLRIATHLQQEPRGGEDGHDREGDVGLAHLEADLILEVSRVVEGGFVEDEDVREGCDEVVDDDAEEPGRACQLCSGTVRTGERIPSDQVERHQLPSPVIASPAALICDRIRRDAEVVGGRLVIPLRRRVRRAGGNLLHTREGAIGREPGCRGQRIEGLCEPGGAEIAYEGVIDLQHNVHGVGKLRLSNDSKINFVFLAVAAA
jgi:hypothetical protein